MKETIQGYIVALPMIGGGETVARLAVVTDDGQEYVVLPKGIGLDLNDHISANVAVTGTISKQDDDTLLLTVRQFEINDGFENEWYDDDE